MGTGTYSQLKPLAHADRLDAYASGEFVAPVHVQIVLSDLCNQDCGFCAYRMSSGLSSELFGTEKTHNPNRKLSTLEALDVVAQCYKLGVKAIQFTGGGEPTVHPEFMCILRLAQSFGIKTALVTNGIKLDALAPEVQALDWIRVSVDAGSEWDYTRLRRVAPAHWAKVWKNVRALAVRYTGRLGIGFVVTPANYHGMRHCAALAKDAGASNIRIGAVFSKEGRAYYGDTVAAIEATAAETVERFDGDGFEVHDMFTRRVAELDDGHPTEPLCGYQHWSTYIGGDGNVYRCCNTAYTPVGILGNIRQNSLREILERREPFDARACTACQFSGQNSAIRSAAKAWPAAGPYDPPPMADGDFV